MSLVNVKNLARYYGQHCAVDHVSFELNAGDILGFLGPNGAGKSTTMQMLSGNLAPSEGEISIDGVDLLDAPKAAKSALGYLPELPPLYKELSVDEYLRYCAQLHRIARSDIASAVDLAKQRCGLGREGKRLIGNLSKGYQQRVGIAQAIVHSPRVIILDEPTVGLDPIQIREIRELITELGKEHGIILSTHILPEVQAVCNRVQIINRGKLVFASDMDSLLQRQETGIFEVAFARAPALEVLSKLPYVTGVNGSDYGRFILTTHNVSAEQIAKDAVTNDWGLLRLTPTQHSLEQIFIELALGDNTSDNAGDTSGSKDTKAA
ncbi:MAG: ATP-binding cassette domain-containing protein [Gammaproteobacteria bacterium]